MSKSFFIIGHIRHAIKKTIIPIIKKNAKVRCHFITLIYKCELPEGYDVETAQMLKVGQAGYLKWFSDYPSNMLSVHSFYKKYFNK